MLSLVIPQLIKMKLFSGGVKNEFWCEFLKENHKFLFPITTTIKIIY